MSSNEVARLRRQMQRRIREVVAERRIARQENAIQGDSGQVGALTADSPA